MKLAASICLVVAALVIWQAPSPVVVHAQPVASGCSAISAWYLLPGQATNDPKIAGTPQYKWAYLDPSLWCYFASDGTLHISTSAVLGQPVMATFECVFSGPATCTVTHNLGTSTPMIGQVIVNSGCSGCWQFANFTDSGFTVTAVLATDITFPVYYAPPAQIIQAQ